MRLVFCVLGLFVAAGGGLANDEVLAFIGTYTGEKSRGIYVSRFDTRTGRLSPAELAAATKHPTFLAVHPKQRVLFAVGEIDDFGGRETGSVSAYRFDAKSGKLALLNQQPSGGTGPCHLAVDATGRCVLVANYGNGSIAALPLEPDGSLGPPATVIQHHGSSVNPQRQEGPHAHFITPDPLNRLVLACDLGLDQVLLYHFEPAKSSLTPSDPAAVKVKGGAGPRHLAFAPSGRFVYVINEMGSTLTVFAYDAKKADLTERQTISTLPAEFRGQSTCAEVQIHPSGKFVYASNRGHDSIAVFTVDARTGVLTLVGHEPTRGQTPRHFVIAPGGRWLLAENQDSNEITVFRVDSRTGMLKATGRKLEVGSPSCIVFAATSF